MNAHAGRHGAVKAVRALLIRTGLTEEEAGSFLDRLADELARGQLGSEDARLVFIEQKLAEILMSQRKAPGRGETAVTGFATGVLGSLVASQIYDALKHEPVILPAEPPVFQPGDCRTTIQIEWAGGFPKIDVANQINHLSRILQWREKRYGTIDNGTAIALDGIGMFLDIEKRHRRAFRLRNQALKITQRTHGRVSESTAAVLSNLGLNLFAQGKFSESDRYLAKALKTTIEALGTNHISTAAAAYNFYFCLHAQGRIRHSDLPQPFLQSLPQIREVAGVMTARKLAIVISMALIDFLHALKEEIIPKK